MSTEKAVGLIIRTTDWSETSRIATFFTREFGKVRVLAKGGRRIKSNFEVALDLLGVCSIVWLRKPQGGLEILTEARSEERFNGLRNNLPNLYAAYYLAELVNEGLQDYDPHPELYERTLEGLRLLDQKNDPVAVVCWFELLWLAEIGYRPRLNECCGCGEKIQPSAGLHFSPLGGGVVCEKCAPETKDKKTLSPDGWGALVNLEKSCIPLNYGVRHELKSILEQTICVVLGKRPRLAEYIVA